MMMISRIGLIFFLTWIGLLLGSASEIRAADEYEFTGIENSFKNFITCELTRTDARPRFKGKSFKITMIHLFAIQKEGRLTIVTGSVQCSVEGKYQTLYGAVGVETVMGKDRAAYFVVREKDFAILASELMKYPYNERCPWSRYWIDRD